jgi:signal transduction histidine kinase
MWMKFKLNRSSLFTKLFFIFFGGAILIVFSLILSFKFLTENSGRAKFKNNLENYVTLMVEKYQHTSDIKAYLTKGDIEFLEVSREEEESIESNNWPKHKFAKEEDFFITHKHRPLVIRLRKDNKSFYFYTSPHHLVRDHSTALIVGILSSLIIIVLIYLIVQNLFSPLKEVEKGTNRFGDGNFEELVPVSGSKEISNVILSVNKMANKLKDLLEVRKTFLLAIAHELKTPLARLRINMELIEDQSRSSSMLEDVSEMNEIISSLLDSSKFENSEQYKFEEIELNDFLKQFQSERVEIIKNQDKVLVSADRLRLKIAIKNLVENALKYSSDIVSVTLDSKYISIQDRGDGVGENQLSKLTEPFYRPDDHRSRNIGGVGLGLYIVSQIVKQHQASLILENNQEGFLARIEF